VSFAEVSLQQAELLLSHTENDLESSYATLGGAARRERSGRISLSDESNPAKPDANVSDLIAAPFAIGPNSCAWAWRRRVPPGLPRRKHALSYRA